MFGGLGFWFSERGWVLVVSIAGSWCFLFWLCFWFALLILTVLLVWIVGGSGCFRCWVLLCVVVFVVLPWGYSLIFLIPVLALIILMVCSCDFLRVVFWCSCCVGVVGFRFVICVSSFGGFCFLLFASNHLSVLLCVCALDFDGSASDVGRLFCFVSVAVVLLLRFWGLVVHISVSCWVSFAAGVLQVSVVKRVKEREQV